MTDSPRINQQGEKLYTVRPRNSGDVTNTRGNVSSIVFMLPDDSDSEEWSNYIPDNSRTAFKQAVDKENGYVNFIAQNVSYDIREKSQILHTFGGQESVYFFGRAPVNVSLSGLLVDDLDNDQFCKFLNLYSNVLNGSSAAKDYCYVELKLPNAIFVGSFTGIQVQQSSDRDTDVTFNAQFLAKSFTLVSTDQIFKNVIDTPVDYVREPDPTLTQEYIFGVTAQNRDAQLNPISPDSTNQNAGNTLSLGDYVRSFGTLPTLEDLIGFSASDVTEFFGDLNDRLNNITKPVQDLANQIDEFVGDTMGLLDSVESGVDSLLSNVKSATNAVFGAINSIDDAVTRIANFPASLVDRLNSISNIGGGVLRVAGSENIPALSAIKTLSSRIPVGSARGTSLGLAALASVSTVPTLSSSNSGASLELNTLSSSNPVFISINKADEIPTIGI